MTLEEKAEKYAQNLEKELMKEYEEHSEYGQTPYLATIPTPHAKQAYIAGAKENGIVWHNLRKDPNDLPEKTELVLIKLVGCFVLGWTDGIDFYNDCDNYKIIPKELLIAWCEIPQFKE